MDLLAAINIANRFESPFGKSGKGIGELVSLFVSNAMYIAGSILLFMLVIGGLGIIMGAGKNDPQQLGRGKAAATAALLGFIIIFTAFWIVQIIEYITGVDIFFPTGV